MKAKLLWSVILFLSINNLILAQTIGFCATETKFPDILQKITPDQIKTAQNSYVVRIFIHIMRRSDGTGGLTQSEVNDALNILFSDYDEHNICFSVLGVDEIKNDTYYNYNSLSIFASDNNGDGKFDNFSPNSHSKAIDIYLFSNDRLNGGKAAGIPATALVIGGNAFGINLPSSHVLSHEVGHCLGLYHTFHGSACEPSGSCPELVSGDNCEICGDFVCDTPADPAIIFDCINQSNCEWLGCTCSGSITDANGDPYNPNTNLIMAYTTPNCMQYHTEGQGSRMRSVIENTMLLQNTLVPDNLTLSDLTVKYGQDILYAVLNRITVQNNVTIQTGGSLTLKAENEIIIQTNFEAALGSEFQVYIDNPCGAINNSAKIVSNEFDESVKSLNEKHIVTEALKIFQNYPNPFNPTTVISYQLPEKNFVTLRVYDILGREIATLINEYQDAGSYKVEFSADEYQLSSGIYFYTFQAGKNYIVKKMMLTK